jgi:nitrite reductase/ring-hydroxylating ferredoxin subunit
VWQHGHFFLSPSPSVSLPVSSVFVFPVLHYFRMSGAGSLNGVSLFSLGAAAAAVGLAAYAAYSCSKSAPAGVRRKRVKLCAVEDVAIGKMKDVAITLPDGTLTKVLVVRQSASRFRALGSKCTHQKVQLSTGVLNGDRVVCPLHGACFNTATGDIEDGCARGRRFFNLLLAASPAPLPHSRVSPQPRLRQAPRFPRDGDGRSRVCGPARV